MLRSLRVLRPLQRHSFRRYGFLPRKTDSYTVQRVRLRAGDRYATLDIALSVSLILIVDLLLDRPLSQIYRLAQEEAANEAAERKKQDQSQAQSAEARKEVSSRPQDELSAAAAAHTHTESEAAEEEALEDADESIVLVDPVTIALSPPVRVKVDPLHEEEVREEAFHACLEKYGGLHGLEEALTFASMKVISEQPDLVGFLGNPFHLHRSVFQVTKEQRPLKAYQRAVLLVTDDNTSHLAREILDTDETQRLLTYIWPESAALALYHSLHDLFQTKYRKWTGPESETTSDPSQNTLASRADPNQGPRPALPFPFPILQPGMIAKPGAKPSQTPATPAASPFSSSPSPRPPESSPTDGKPDDTVARLVPAWIRRAVLDPDVKDAMKNFGPLLESLRNDSMHRNRPTGVLNVDGMLEVRGSQGRCVVNVRWVFDDPDEDPSVSMSVFDFADRVLPSAPRGAVRSGQSKSSREPKS